MGATLTQTLSLTAFFWHTFIILTGLSSVGFAGQTSSPCDLSIAQLPKNTYFSNNFIRSSAGTTRITPMWAQEAIGAPESIEFLNSLSQRGRRFTAVPVGISDSNFDLQPLSVEKLNLELKQTRAQQKFANVVLRSGEVDNGQHSYLVSNFISDARGFGNGYNGYFSWIVNDISTPKTNIPFHQAQVKPWFVNKSTGSINPTVMETSEELSDLSQQTIIVASAGNDFPWPSTKGKYPAIIVGSINRYGMMSSSSSHGSQVDVSAPGDSVLGFTGKNELDLMSGTSIAAPFVTGALVSVASLLPGIKIDEIRAMIQRTAIKTVAYMDPATGDGVGVINQYAMLRVADRLAPHWPSNRNQLHENWPYDFQGEIAERKKSIHETLKKKVSTCEVQRSLLRQARQNFFLNNLDEESRLLISNIYRQNEYEYQFIFFNIPEFNTKLPNIAVNLRKRKFEIGVSMGNINLLRFLKDVQIHENNQVRELLRIAAFNGYTEVLRFLTTDWMHISLSSGEASDLLKLALNHKATTQYIFRIPTTPTTQTIP